MTNFPVKRYSCYLLAFSVAMTPMLGEAIEFNTDILSAQDKSNIDLSRFADAGYIMPGEYQLAITINGKMMVQESAVSVSDRMLGDKKISEVCLTPELVTKLSLTDKALLMLKEKWNDNKCVDMTPVISDKTSINIPRGFVNLTVPQAYLEYSDDTWLPPSRWENGIPGILLDYNANTNATAGQAENQNKNASVNGTLGANYGAWRLRADYQGSYSNSPRSKTRQQFDWSRVYMYRALPTWLATLGAGENTVTSDLFDSWNYTGVSLLSDERQLAPKLRGYAPQINGIAETNAKVTVSLQGRVIYETTVPPGPFTISDLSSALRGTLDVKVTEQNGSVKTFQVSAAQVPYLTRPGQIRYKLYSGRSRNSYHTVEGPVFAAGELSYGLSNLLSVYGGSVLSNGYNSVALGAGADLRSMGTISADMTEAIAQPDDKKRYQGKSWRVSYSKRFAESNTDVQFAGYRFSDRDYRTMQQFLDMRYRGNTTGQSKELYTILLNKNFSDSGTSVGLSYNYQTFWNQSNSSYYSLNANQAFSAFGLNNLSASLSATRTQFAESGRMDNAVYLRLSVPLGQGYLNYSGGYEQGNVSQTVGYNNYLSNGDSYNVNAGLRNGDETGNDAQFNGYYSHYGDRSRMSANMSTVNGRYVSAGLSADGGVTLTGKGVVFHPGGSNGSTRMLVDTDGVEDVPFDGGRVRTNSSGLGVVTDLNSFYKNDISVDVNGLNDETEARGSHAEAALTDGAIGYRKFDVLSGVRLFAVMTLEDHSVVPFGVSVIDKKGRELGIVGDDGIAWLSGVQSGEVLTATWDETTCETKVPEKLESLGKVLLPCQIINQ